MKKFYPCSLLLALTLFTQTSKAQVNKSDSLALVDLYNSTNGSAWYNHTNWLSSKSVSTWYGVKVNNSRVSVIHLLTNNLNGSIPASIGNLSSLTGLALVDNPNLTGEIPLSITNLTNLGSLSLANNNLSGSIPASIGRLKKLGFLDISNNKLTGTIPNSICRLYQLTQLEFSENKLSGKIPAALSNDTNLYYIGFASNNLIGEIPESINKLPFLISLGLSNNKLSGDISFLKSTPKLQSIYLNDNQLSGSIEWLQDCKLIMEIYLQNNQFTGKLPDFKQLPKLTDVNVSVNKLTGSISSVDSCINLQSFNCSNNQLSGKVPVFNNLIHLRDVNIANNKFTFSGMEDFSKINGSVYAPQAIVNINQNGTVLSVSVGGTLANNTYMWYKNGVLIKTKTGDASFSTRGSGNYTVSITNSVATALTLYSDTLSYNGLIALNNEVNNANKASDFSMYPNPASTSTTINVNQSGNCSIKISDVNGHIFQNISSNSIKNNTIQIDVSKYANGLYFVSLIQDGKEIKTLRLIKD